MNEMFSQGGKGSTGILTNKQAVARHFGVKQSEVVYFSTGAVLSGYKVIYDKASQRAYSLPADIGSGVTAVSLSPAGVLVHSAGNVDLGALAVERKEYINSPGSFTTGATLTVKNQRLIHNGEYYIWNGAFPKVVPASSTPENSGGVANDAWSKLSPLVKSEEVPYVRMPNAINTNVAANMDLMGRRVIYATDFGVTVDSADNADALWELGQYLSTQVTEPVKVIFPAGTSLVGSQYLTGSTGQGGSYKPSYEQRAWTDASAKGWFSIHMTDANIELEMSNWTLKINDGMRLGAFDPVTGSIAPDVVAETPDYSYMAYQGFLIKLYKAPNVVINGGTSDGNLASAVWGGKFGNTGYQIPCYNMWINQSAGARVYRHKYLNSPVDGLYHQSTGSFSFLDIVPRTVIEDCYWDSCGRNCYSLTGGANIDIINPVITRSGNKAGGIGTHYTGPEAGIDIEAEGGNPYNIRVINPKIVNTGKCAFQTVSVPGTVNDILVVGGVLHSMHSEGAVSNAGNARNIKFVGTTIIGSIIDTGWPAAMGFECYSFIDCELQNRYANDYADEYRLNFKVKEFKGNTITFGIPPTINTNHATINIEDQDATPFGLYAERFKENRLIVYGDASKVTFANGLGGIRNFKNAELYVSADGLTGGTLKITVDTSSAAMNGLSTNTANFNFDVAMDKDVGKNVWYARKVNRVAGVMTAVTDSLQDIGSKDGRFGTMYATKGIILRDVGDSTYKRLRSNNGVLEVVADNT
ncbi:tailspike protein [Escherichia phage E20]|nr:tailspike protein [Escherichia phage E20]WBF79670.1 tailspike [Escherichia phage vB_Eco_F22]